MAGSRPQTRRIHEVGPEFVPTLETAVAFYAPKARPEMQAAVEAGMANGTPWDMELPFVTATGRSIWVWAVGEVEFEDGKPVRLVGAFQDITARKQLEQRVADSELFVRQITDNLPVRIAYVDRDLRYRFINQAHCLRFGLAREQIIGRTRSELTNGAGDAQVEPLIAAVLAGRPQHFEFEEAAGDTRRRIESRLIPDISDSGEVRGFFTTGVDITERSKAERALRELTEIFDNTTDYVVQTDWRGNILYMNPAVRRLCGLALDAAVEQRNFAEFNTPATNRIFDEFILPAVKTGRVWIGPTTVYGKDKLEVPVNHMVIAHRDAAGRIDRYSAVMRDISAELQAGRLQQRHTATLRSVTEAIPALVSVLDADGRYRFVNAAFERFWGVARDSIVGRSMAEVLGRVEYELSRPWVERVLRGEAVQFEKAYPARGPTHHLSISYIPLWLETGEVDGFVAVVQDITQQKQEELRLLQLTQRDQLTGLLNRAGFEEHLERQIGLGFGASLALLYIDLDHFKPVNDRHGHPVGDQVLQNFAQRLQKLVRPDDAVARLGGDEFAIVLSNVRASANAMAVAEKVVAAARAPFGIHALQLHIGASVGIAFGVDAADGWRSLVERADARLYQAKAAGRGRVAGEGEAQGL